MGKIPVNKEFKINDYKDLPTGTYGSAMILTETMEGWRSYYPSINTDKCKSCNLCYLACPEGVIYKEEGKLKIDYRFCKGCGICAKECKVSAIEMIKEGSDNSE